MKLQVHFGCCQSWRSSHGGLQSQENHREQDLRGESNQNSHVREDGDRVKIQRSETEGGVDSFSSRGRIVPRQFTEVSPRDSDDLEDFEFSRFG